VADFRKATLNLLSRRALVLVLSLAWTAPTFAQKSLSQIIPGAEPPKETAPAPVFTDPLGRATPNGTLFGLLQAVQSGKLEIAAQYLQLSASKRQTVGPELASQLKLVLDRGFVGSLKAVSTNPEGTAQPGLPSNKERIGTLSVRDIEVDVILTHVDDPEGPGKIWLFSQETLARIPDLYESLQSQEVERHIPTTLVRMQLFGMSAWQWLALLLGIPISIGVGWLLLQILSIPRRIWEQTRHLPRNRAFTALKGPVWTTLALLTHGLIASSLRLPLIDRHYYYRVTGIAFIAALAWLILRILTFALEQYRDHVLARTGSTGSLFILSQRVAKTVIVIIAGLAILSVLGLDLTTALAGLGIGGLAIGFGAQKTIENLFGGASVLADEVIRVGDSCNFAGRVGTVEDISFRSTRIRTVERTELSIPNGTLGTMNIENLTRRDKILFNPTMGLRIETTPDQLRYVLAECRRLLYEHPKVETASARVRFAALLENSLSLEFFSYILTKDFAEFTAIREDLLLRVMDIVKQSGTGFAFPARTLYLGKDAGLDPELTEEAQKKVEAWRKEKDLPFPDFAQTEISQMRDSLAYPDPDSAVNNKKW
jgi:MscS family membrane protein